MYYDFLVKVITWLLLGKDEEIISYFEYLLDWGDVIIVWWNMKKMCSSPQPEIPIYRNIEVKNVDTVKY